LYKIAGGLAGPKHGRATLLVEESVGPTEGVIELFNDPIMRSAEAPSCNGHASARAMAKIASVMAAGGTAHGVQLMSQRTCLLAQGTPVLKYDSLIRVKTKFTRGGLNVFDGNIAYDRQGSVGWFGIGGSAFMWHNELNVGFGYACTLFGADLGNKNSALVQVKTFAIHYIKLFFPL
jgi:hypothetical protein